jgi:multiple sugar transport system substrate-binding protein
MTEGTYPQNTHSKSDPENKLWETPPTVFPSSLDKSDLPSEQKPPPVEEQVYSSKPNKEYKIIEGGSEKGSGSGNRKIFKIGLGLFIALTIFLVIITFLFSRFSNNTNEEVTLNYWGLGIDEAVMRPVLSEFEKENPLIKIDYKKQDPVDYRERLLTRSKIGTGPDIFRYHNTWYPVISDILLPLPQEVIKKSEFEENYYDVAKKDLIKKGAIYAIPLQTDTLALYVNTQLFDQESSSTGSLLEYPKTWQEFINTSYQLTKKDEEGRIMQSGAAIGTYENVNHAPDILSALFAQNGVDLDNPMASKDKMADAIRFYTTFARGNDNIWDSTQDNSLLAFSQGKVAMYFGYSGDYFLIKAQNPNIPIKIVPIPQLISDERVNIASYWVEGVSKESKHLKEALIFMEFLSRPQTQEKLFSEQSKTRAFGEPYSIKNLAEKLKDSDAFVFADQSGTSVSTPFTDGASDNSSNNKFNEFLKESINSVLSGDSEESGVEKLIQGYNQVSTEINGVVN